MAGYLYVANEAHTSDTLLENDQAKWDLYAEGFDWKTRLGNRNSLQSKRYSKNIMV